MTKAVAFLGRQQLFQLLLHLVGILGVAQPQPVGDPDAVGVRHHHAGDVENIAAHEIGGFPSHPRQLDELLHRLGNLPVIHVPQHPRHGHDVPGLGLVQPAGSDIFPHLLGGGVGKRVEGRVPLEQRRGYQVHPRVGALGGQPGGDEELERVGIGQGTDGVRIALAQRLDGGYCHSFFSHKQGPFCRFPDRTSRNPHEIGRISV